MGCHAPSAGFVVLFAEFRAAGDPSGDFALDELVESSRLCFQPFTVSHASGVVRRQVHDAAILGAQRHLRAQQCTNVDRL